MKMKLCVSFLALSASLWAPTPTHAAGFDQACPAPSQVSCASGSTDCMNTPFEPTDCMTTPYGPARANVVVVQSPPPTPAVSPNMLLCPGGRPYALCYFSGPANATGHANSGNQALPCVVDATLGIAKCSCQVYTTGSYYVDINSILNRGLFNQTRWTCGIDGSRCRNMRDCNSDGSSKGSFACPSQVAPVCSFINAQGSGDKSTWFYPNNLGHVILPQESAPDLVSTFSYAMNSTYSISVNPPSCSGQYAGCMTAPCWYPEGSTRSDGSIVQCACPLWTGTYQVGQQNQSCSAGAGYVWSAANTVSSTCAANPSGEQ